MSDPLRRVDALVEEDNTLPSLRVRQQLRLAAGLTQAEVAAAIGVQRLAVARWEAGATQPHRGNRRAYAHLLRRLTEKYPDAAAEGASDAGSTSRSRPFPGAPTPPSVSRGSG
ncbi:helix-turn-helix transcriptional regulator [Streptomyces xanthophaeus]